MTEITKLDENLYTFPIPLPNNPLKWLNCYVIRGVEGSRSLLIDTGFYKSECTAALEHGMQQLQLKPENTDVFITHLHSDHSDNGRYLQDKGCRILMSRIDYLRYMDTTKNHWLEGGMLANREGMPWEHLKQMYRNNREVSVTSGGFDAETVEPGDVLCYNGQELECVLTPGHSPGHICLYNRQDKTMFLGDHVLFDISPNITFWSGIKDPLGNYLNSLRYLQSFEIERGLPAHRNLPHIPVRQRIDELLAHHGRRLENLKRVVREEPGLNAYQIAGRMHWHIHARSWEDFPPSQQYFALGETLAHLDHLLLQGEILRKEDAEGAPHYYLA